MMPANSVGYLDRQDRPNSPQMLRLVLAKAKTFAIHDEYVQVGGALVGHEHRHRRILRCEIHTQLTSPAEKLGEAVAMLIRGQLQRILRSWKFCWTVNNEMWGFYMTIAEHCRGRLFRTKDRPVI